MNKMCWNRIPHVFADANSEGGVSLCGAVAWCEGGNEHPGEEGFFFYFAIDPKNSNSVQDEFHALELTDAELWLSSMLAAVRVAKEINKKEL